MRHERIAVLQEELRILDVLDRLQDCSDDHPDLRADGAYLARQTKRAEILAELAKLRPGTSWFERLLVGSSQQKAL